MMRISKNVRTVSALSGFFFFAALFFTIACQESFATDFYMDAVAGDDTNNGTDPDFPLKTLSELQGKITLLAPGDHIYFQRGDKQIFYPDSTLARLGILTINDQKLGEEGQPIVLGTYGSGAAPVIDGSGRIETDGTVITELVWTLANGEANIYSAPRTIEKNIIVPNILLYNDTPYPPLTTLKLNDIPTELVPDAVLMRRDPYGTFWVKSIDGFNVTGISGITKKEQEFSEGQMLTFRYVNNNGEEVGYKEADLTIQKVISSGTDANAALAAYGQSGQWYWDGSTNLEDGNAYTGSIYLYSTVDPTSITKVPWASDGIRIENSNYIVIQGLEIRNMNKQGTVLWGSDNVTLEDNKISFCGRNGMQIWLSSNNIIQNNSIEFVTGGMDIWAFGGGKAENNLVSNNTIQNCRGACIGISREGSTTVVADNIISGNTISYANTTGYDGAGIYTYYAGANTISGNTISSCGSKYLRSAGIQIDLGGGGPMTITGNTITGNSLAGIAVSGTGHKIEGNILTNNGIANMGIPRSQLNFFAAGTVAFRCTITDNKMTADSGFHFVTAEYGSCSSHRFSNNSYDGEALKENEQFFWPCINETDWIDLETWKRNIDENIFIFLNGWIHSKK